MVQRPVEVETDDDLKFRLLEQELPSWHPPYIFAAMDTLFAVPSTIICIDSLFYAPEAHIMYLTASSWFLISFVMGGSGLSKAIKFLYAPEQPEQGD
jgi:hypothetical protein